jgi:ABC-type protease/lipase transport system fused ATPase/permease subunit
MALRVMKEKGMTVIFITHKQNILSLADKLLVLKEGQAVYYDEREKVMNALSGNTPKKIEENNATDREEK